MVTNNLPIKSTIVREVGRRSIQPLPENEKENPISSGN